MEKLARLVIDLHRLVLVVLVALPALACNNSDSIGRLSGGGSTGLGGSPAGTGGAGAGGAKSGDGGPGVGGATSGAGGGLGGGQAGTGGAGGAGTGGTGAGGTKSGDGGVGTGGANGGAGGQGTVGTGGQGGRDAASDAYQCVITDVYCIYGYVLDANGCPVCAPAPGGTGGSGGTGGGTGGSKSEDAGKPDVQVSIDAQDMAALCTTTGGQITTGLCCTNVVDFPDSCSVGACGCSPTSSHTVATCTCPSGDCFSTKTGCGSRTGGQGGAGGSNSSDAGSLADSNGCMALPASDSTACGGASPPHFYTCTLTMLPAPCVIRAIGNVTNTFCCP